MSGWMTWMIAAGMLVILEIFSGTFYLLVLGLGLAAGGVVALAGGGYAAQFLAAAAIGLLGIYALRRWRAGRPATSKAGRDPSVNLDIGQTLTVEQWQAQGESGYVARAMYRGAYWDVELESGGTPTAGVFVIREVRGNRLIVVNSGFTGKES